MKKALVFLLTNMLLLGGFPDFRIGSQPDYRNSKFPLLQTLPPSTYDFSNLTAPSVLPSPEQLLATPTPVPTATPAPTPTPAPTKKPKPTPKPTQLPIGKKKVQSKKPGDLTFNYPETAELNTDTATYTFLVNKEYPMSSSYIPYMVEPDVEIYHKGINERRYLQPIAATALEEMFAAAEENGHHLVMRCGFRSYRLQKSIYAWNLETYGYYEVTRYHALAGTSEHQTGLAVDLCCKATNYENNYDFLKTAEYDWLLENAHLYGWTLRFPEDKTFITGYNFEPWHFRYVGVELATYLKENDLVLEEYYGAVPATNLIRVPEEYWELLSDEEFELMEQDQLAFEEWQEEYANRPTPTPKPTPTPEPTPEIEEPNDPEAEITPEITPDTEDITIPSPEIDPDNEDSEDLTPDTEDTADATPKVEEPDMLLPEDEDPEAPSFPTAPPLPTPDSITTLH